METQKQSDPGEFLPKLGLLRGFFFALFGILRAAAILAALAFVAAGGYLAYDLFSFFKQIVEEPSGIVREWQAVVQADGGGSPAQSMPTAPDESPPAPPAPVAEVIAPEAPVLPTVAVAPIEASETPATGDEAPAAPEGALPGEEATVPAPEGVTPQSPAGPSQADLGGDVNEGRARGRIQRPFQPEQEENPWVGLAGQALEALEAGSFNWFAGLALLVAFCWILGKIPALIITTGLRVLVDLFKVGSENS